MADPRIVRNPRPIRKITYNELRELSYMGASVLHEDAIFPILDSNIPINILNTNDPDNPGTIIVSELDDDAQDDTIITGIAAKKTFRLFPSIKIICPKVLVQCAKHYLFLNVTVYLSNIFQVELILSALLLLQKTSRISFMILSMTFEKN